MLSYSIGMPNRNDNPPDIWDTHGFLDKRFSKSTVVFFSILFVGVKVVDAQMYQKHKSAHVMSESQTPAQDQRCQSGPSVRKSFVPGEGDLSKNHGADQQRLQIPDPHFDKSTTPAIFACWKMRFKTEVCICSQFPTGAMLCIKEVELIHSVNDPKTWCSLRGIQMPKFEVFDTKIASAPNRIIHNSHSKRRVSLEEQEVQKEDRFLRGRQIAFLIYEYFRITGANDSVENYADIFTIDFRSDDIQEFDSSWDGYPPPMTKNPMWWHLGKFVQIKNTRVCKNSRPYWNCTIWRFIRWKLDLIITDWKTVVKRSIE